MQHGLPTPPTRTDAAWGNLPECLRVHSRYDRLALSTKVAQALPGLNQLRRKAYDAVTEAIARSPHTSQQADAFVLARPPSVVFFIYSPGECGKTHLNQVLLNQVRSQGAIALAMAASGIAALLIEGGATFHSGEKVVVLSGDLRQILSVVRDDDQNATLRAFLTFSPLWQRVHVLTLEENMRIRGAHDAGQDATLLRWLADLLLAVGEGRVPQPPPTVGTPHAIPPPPPPQVEFLLPPFMHPPPELNSDPIRLLDHVYRDFNDARNTTEKTLIDRAILTPKNKDVDALNDHAVQSFPGEKKVYLSADRLAQDENEGAYPTELLNSMNPPGFAPHQLRLKVGIPIILLRNVKKGRTIDDQLRYTSRRPTCGVCVCVCVCVCV